MPNIVSFCCDTHTKKMEDRTLINRLIAAMGGNTTPSRNMKAVGALLRVKAAVLKAVDALVNELRQNTEPVEDQAQLKEEFGFDHRELVTKWIDARILSVDMLPRNHQLVVGLFACMHLHEVLKGNLSEGQADLIDQVSVEFEQVASLGEPDFLDSEFLDRMAEAFAVEY